MRDFVGISQPICKTGIHVIADSVVVYRPAAVFRNIRGNVAISTKGAYFLAPLLSPRSGLRMPAQAGRLLPTMSPMVIKRIYALLQWGQPICVYRNCPINYDSTHIKVSAPLAPRRILMKDTPALYQIRFLRRTVPLYSACMPPLRTL